MRLSVPALLWLLSAELLWFKVTINMNSHQKQRLRGHREGRWAGESSLHYSLQEVCFNTFLYLCHGLQIAQHPLAIWELYSSPCVWRAVSYSPSSP